MPPLTAEQYSHVAKVDRFERLQSGLRFGELTGSRLAAILKDNERGYANEWADLAEYIARDPHVASIYHTRKIRVSGARWVLEPGGTEPRDEEAAVLCDKMLRAIPALKQHFLDLLDGIGVGFAVSEIIWKPTANLVKVADLRWTHQRRFVWGEEYDLRLTQANSRTRGTALPANKFVAHMPKEQSGYPPRSGALQVCAWHWLFKRQATAWWYHNLEKTGTPIMYGKVPTNMRQEVRDAFLTDLKRMSYDHVGIIPTDAELIIETAGAEAQKGGDNPFSTFMRVMDEQLSKAIIGSTDMTESGPNGARAATETRKEATLDPRMIADGEQLWGTLQRDLLRPFLAFNLHRFGGVMPAIPRGRFLHRDVDFEITPEVASSSAASLNEIRRAAGLPVIEGRDRPLRDEGAAALPGGQAEEGEAVVAGADDVQKAALNGAQVTALQGMVESVAQGQIPRDSAVAMIAAAFPLTREQAEEIVGDAGAGFTPAQQEPSGGSGAFPFHRSGSAASLTSSSPTSTNPIATALYGRSGGRRS